MIHLISQDKDGDMILEAQIDGGNFKSNFYEFWR
jgi:hypothetical protein